MYFDFSFNVLESSVEAFEKCLYSAGNLFHTALIVLSLEATHLIEKILPIRSKLDSNDAAKRLSSFIFLGDWWYNAYNVSMNNWKLLVPLTSLRVSQTASSSLWLQQCYTTIFGYIVFNLTPTPATLPSIADAPSLTNAIRFCFKILSSIPFEAKFCKIALFIVSADVFFSSTIYNYILFSPTTVLKQITNIVF